MFTIEMLHANEGDALWIEYGPDGGDVHRVLIDCGRKSAYREVRKRILALRALLSAHLISLVQSAPW